MPVNIDGKDYYINKSNDFELLLPNHLGSGNPITAKKDGYSVSILTNGFNGSPCNVEQPVQKDIDKIEELQSYMAQLSEDTFSADKITGESLDAVSDRSASAIPENASAGEAERRKSSVLRKKQQRNSHLNWKNV